MFRGKFIEALRTAHDSGELARDPSNTPSARRIRLKALNRHDWVVYAKTPLAGPEVVLDYLSRTTHRVAVSNEHILSMDAAGVRLRVRVNHEAGQAGKTVNAGKRVITIDGPEFIGAVQGAAVSTGPRLYTISMIAGPHRPGAERARPGHANQTTWATLMQQKQAVTQRANSPMRAKPTLPRAKSIFACALPKLPR